MSRSLVPSWGGRHHQGHHFFVLGDITFPVASALLALGPNGICLRTTDYTADHDRPTTRDLTGTPAGSLSRDKEQCGRPRRYGSRFSGGSICDRALRAQGRAFRLDRAGRYWRRLGGTVASGATTPAAVTPGGGE